MCMNASVGGRSIMTGQKMDKWRKTSGQQIKGGLLAKKIANEPEVQKGTFGLGGRLIK